MSRGKNYTRLFQYIFILLCAYIGYYLGGYLSNSLGIDTLSKALFRLATILGFFLVATWHVRTKHNSLFADSSKKYSMAEQRRLAAIIKNRNANSTLQILFYVLTATLLVSANFLVKIKLLESYINPISIMLLSVSIALFIFSIFTYKEIEQFERDVEERIAKEERKKTLLESIDQEEDKK